jgi:hypothetical protein
MRGRITKLFDREESVGNIEGSIKSNKDSPDRFNIPFEIGKYSNQGRPGGLSSMVTMASNMLNLFKVLNSLKKNPKSPRSEITETEMQEVKKFAAKKHVIMMGFTKISENLVFKDKAVLHPHFANEYGCSICIKECPFNRTDYYTLKKNFPNNEI